MKKIIMAEGSLNLLDAVLSAQIANAIFAFKTSSMGETGLMFKILINFEKGTDPMVTVIRDAPKEFLG